MNGGEQYSLDVALLKIREEKRKRKMRTERTAILFVVWLLVFRVCGIMRVDGNSMRPACHPGDIVFFLRIRRGLWGCRHLKGCIRGIPDQAHRRAAGGCDGGGP